MNFSGSVAALEHFDKGIFAAFYPVYATSHAGSISLSAAWTKNPHGMNNYHYGLHVESVTGDVILSFVLAEDAHIVTGGDIITSLFISVSRCSR